MKNKKAITIPVVLLIVISICISIGLYLHFTGIKITIDIPERVSLPKNTMSSVLSSIEKGQLTGNASLAKGRFKIDINGETYTLDVNSENTKIEYSFLFKQRESVIQENNIVITPNIEILSFSVVPPITIKNSAGVSATLDNLSNKEKKNEIDLQLKFNAATHVADLFLHSFLDYRDQTEISSKEQWQTLIPTVYVQLCRIDMQPNASITFNQNLFAFGSGSWINLENFYLSNQGFQGKFKSNFELIKGSEFIIDDMKLIPEKASLTLSGKFTKDTKSLTFLSDGKEDSNTLKIEQTAIESLNRNENTLKLNLSKAVFNFDKCEYSEDVDGNLINSRYSVVSAIFSNEGQIPINNGMLKFDTLDIPSLKMDYKQDGGTEKNITVSIDKINLYKPKINTVSGKDHLAVTFINIEAKEISSNSFRDLELNIPQINLKPSKVVFTAHEGKKIIITFGFDSKISIGSDSLLLNLNPSKKSSYPVIQQINLKGAFPKIWTDLGGTQLPLDNVQLDLDFDFKSGAAVKGSISTDIKGNVITQSLGQMNAFNLSNEIRVNPPSISGVGVLNLRADVDIQDNMKKILLNGNMRDVVTIHFVGTKGLNCTTRFFDFGTALNLSEKDGKATLKTQIISHNYVEVYYDTRPAAYIPNPFGPDIEVGTLVDKAELRPFNITVKLDCKVKLKGNQLIITPTSWNQLDNNEYCVWAKSDRYGVSGTGCAKLTDDKISIDARLLGLINIKTGGDNEVKTKLNELMGKEFRVQISQ